MTQTNTTETSGGEPQPGDLLFRSTWETTRDITHDEAREISRRLIASHFRRGDTEQARVGIPARPDYDDDLLICSYIKQQARKDATGRALASAPPAPSTGEGEKPDRHHVAWAVSRWRAEVENRPLRNVHRRSLDTTWRQVIRHFGGDPDALVGPSHDDLANEAPSPVPGEAGDLSGQGEMPASCLPTIAMIAAWLGRPEAVVQTMPEIVDGFVSCYLRMMKVAPGACRSTEAAPDLYNAGRLVGMSESARIVRNDIQCGWFRADGNTERQAAALAIEMRAEQYATSSPSAGDLVGLRMVPVKPTRDWARNLMFRNGEEPTRWEINWAMDRIQEVLNALPNTIPVPGDTEGLADHGGLVARKCLTPGATYTFKISNHPGASAGWSLHSAVHFSEGSVEGLLNDGYGARSPYNLYRDIMHDAVEWAAAEIGRLNDIYREKTDKLAIHEDHAKQRSAIVDLLERSRQPFPAAEPQPDEWVRTGKTRLMHIGGPAYCDGWEWRNTVTDEVKLFQEFWCPNSGGWPHPHPESFVAPVPGDAGDLAGLSERVIGFEAVPDFASAVATAVMGLGWAIPEPSGVDEDDAEEQCRRHGMVQEAVAALTPAPSRPAVTEEEIAKIIRTKVRVNWAQYATTLDGVDEAAEAVVTLFRDADRAAGEGWLPIESAPKEQQPILLTLDRGRYGDIHRAPAIAFWSEKANDWRHWNGEEVSLGAEPTHWRPLPSAPAKDVKGGDHV